MYLNLSTARPWQFWATSETESSVTLVLSKFKEVSPFSEVTGLRPTSENLVLHKLSSLRPENLAMLSPAASVIPGELHSLRSSFSRFLRAVKYSIP